MKSRLDTLKRIERLQKRLHDLSQWRLTNLGARRNQLASAHLEMLDSLGTGLFAFGAPAAAATRRIRALEVEITVAQASFEKQAKQTFDHGVKSRLADRAVESAEALHRAEAEKKSLSELIEWTLQANDSASRKA